MSKMLKQILLDVKKHPKSKVRDRLQKAFDDNINKFFDHEEVKNIQELVNTQIALGMILNQQEYSSFKER